VTKPVVLVTGAGGFIGGWIAEAFHLSGFADVRAGIGRWSSAARIARFPVDIVLCDVTRQDSLDAALKGVDAVVHCAIAKGNDNSVTLSGTKLLLDRMKAAGVPRLIYMSSVAVYGDPTGVVHEDSAPTEPLSIYGAGKRQAEEMCRAQADEKLAIAAVRPTLVYGPYSAQWTTPYITRFNSGKWRALGPAGEGKCNLVYVGDLVRFARFLIENDTGLYEAFNANGPEVPTWNSYIERFNAALGNAPLPPPAAAGVGLQAVVRRPVRALGKYMLAHHRDLLIGMAKRSPALRNAMRKTEEDLRIRANDDEVLRFRTDVTYSMDKAARFGFVPPTSVDQGLAWSAEWARDMHLVA